jgi:MFS family permease
MLRLLRDNNELRSLSIGVALAQLGSQVRWACLIWFAVVHLHSSTLIGILFGCDQLPALLTGPILGSMMDRFDARRVAFFSIIAATLTSFGLALAVSVGSISTILLLSLVALISAVRPGGATYLRTAIPRLSETSSMSSAYSIIAFTAEISLLAGPPVGGLLGGWRPAWGFIVGGCGSLLFALAVLREKRQSVAGAQQTPQPWDGLIYLVRSPVLRGFGLLTFLFFLAYGPLEVSVPLISKGEFHTSGAGYGLIWTAYGIGAALGLLLLPKLYQQIAPHKILALIAATWGVFTMGLSVTHSYWLFCVIFCAAGFMWSPYNPLESAAVQRYVPPNLRGSVFGIQSVAVYSLPAPLGAMIGGIAIAHTNPHVMLFISGLACVVVGMVGYLMLEKAVRTVRLETDFLKASG